MTVPAPRVRLIEESDAHRDRLQPTARENAMLAIASIAVAIVAIYAAHSLQK